jgi:hypothetical protein
MSFSRHPETDGLTKRVNITFQQFLRYFCFYSGTNWKDLLPQVEFAYNATRALGIEQSPFEANFGFSHEEPLDLSLSMRPSIPVSQDASKRLKLLHEVHALVLSVFQLHKDDMQARSKPSTAPHVVRRDEVIVVTKHLFLRGQPNMKLRDRRFGPFTMEGHIGKQSYKLKLLATICLHCRHREWIVTRRSYRPYKGAGCGE